MLAHKVLLPGATTLERFVAKLRHRVDVRVWRVLASGHQSATDDAAGDHNILRSTRVQFPSV